MRLEVTCLINMEKRKFTYWKDDYKKHTNVDIWREFAIYSDADKQLYVELFLDIRRGGRSISRKKIATRMPLESVMQNNNMLTKKDIEKIGSAWVEINVYDEELEVQWNLGEIRAFTQLTEKDVEQLCTAVEAICEV